MFVFRKPALSFFSREFTYHIIWFRTHPNGSTLLNAVMIDNCFFDLSVVAFLGNFRETTIPSHKAMQWKLELFKNLRPPPPPLPS